MDNANISQTQISTINYIKMQVSPFFHQGKQQHTLVLDQSLKSSCDLSQGQRSRSNRHTPKITKMRILGIFYKYKYRLCLFEASESS